MNTRRSFIIGSLATGTALVVPATAEARLADVLRQVGRAALEIARGTLGEALMNRIGKRAGRGFDELVDSGLNMLSTFGSRLIRSSGTERSRLARNLVGSLRSGSARTLDHLVSNWFDNMSDFQHIGECVICEDFAHRLSRGTGLRRALRAPAREEHEYEAPVEDGGWTTVPCQHIVWNGIGYVQLHWADYVQI